VTVNRPWFSRRSAWHRCDLLRLLQLLDCRSVVDGVTCFHGFIDDLTGRCNGWVLGDRAALSVKPANVLTESVSYLMQTLISDNDGHPMSRQSVVT